MWGNFESRPFSQYVFMCYGREGFCGAPPAAATGTRMLDSIMHDPCEIISALAPDSVAAVGQSTPLFFLNARPSFCLLDRILSRIGTRKGVFKRCFATREAESAKRQCIASRAELVCGAENRARGSSMCGSASVHERKPGRRSVVRGPVLPGAA